MNDVGERLDVSALEIGFERQRQKRGRDMMRWVSTSTRRRIWSKRTP